MSDEMSDGAIFDMDFLQEFWEEFINVLHPKCQTTAYVCWSTSERMAYVIS